MNLAVGFNLDGSCFFIELWIVKEKGKQPNKSFDYNLFWRDHEEVEMKIDSAPILQ